MAEDSRVMEDGKPKDNDCKIITLGSKMIFGFTGTRSFELTAPKIGVRIHWEAHEAAIQAYRLSTSKTTRDVAKQFAILAKHTFGDAITLQGVKRFAERTGADPRAPLPIAIFAGIGSNGEPDQFLIKLSYSAPQRKVVWTNDQVSPSATDSTPIRAYVCGSSQRSVRFSPERLGSNFALNACSPAKFVSSIGQNGC